ncbi:MAG TPA: hypothetical protein VKU82_13135 [Planctomycetaceae bacterium]|nr:hypothetical protein [Planctomycetaceae bacterium]
MSAGIRLAEDAARIGAARGDVSREMIFVAGRSAGESHTFRRGGTSVKIVELRLRDGTSDLQGTGGRLDRAIREPALDADEDLFFLQLVIGPKNVHDLPQQRSSHFVRIALERGRFH